MLDFTALIQSGELESYIKTFESFVFRQEHLTAKGIANALGLSDKQVDDYYRMLISVRDEIKKGKLPDSMCLMPERAFDETELMDLFKAMAKFQKGSPKYIDLRNQIAILVLSAFSNKLRNKREYWHNRFGMELGACESISNLGVLRAIARFNFAKRKSCKFLSLLLTALEQERQDHWRSRQKRKIQPVYIADLSLEEISSPILQTPSLEETLEKNERIDQMLAIATSEERNALQGIMDGYDYAEMAKKTRVSKSFLWRMMQAFKKRCIARGLWKS